MSKPAGILPILVFVLLLGLGTIVFPQQGEARGDKRDLSFGASIVLAKASRLMESNQYDQAIATLREFQATDSNPTATDASDCQSYQHAEIYFAIGTCYLMQNNYQQSVKTLDLAVQNDPQHLSAWLNLAKSYYELKNYLQAAECFTKVYKLSPEKKLEHLYYSAVAFLLAQQYERSIGAFERLFTDYPQNIEPPWRENLVHAMLSGNHARKALPHIKILAQQYSGKKQIQWQEILLQQYMALGMGKKALAYALFLADQAPTQPKWWKALASIYLQKGKYQSALTAMVIDGYLEPLSDQETKLVADLYLQLGIPGKAEGLYRALFSEKKTPKLVERLSLSLRQLGKPEEALTVLDKFAQTCKAPELLMQKADVLYELGKYQAAAELYRQTAKKGSRQKDRALQMAKYAMLQASYKETNRHQSEQVMTF